tara:strand:+ start:161 stop:340 length:180 start_codon:yes stop_codon:yes gene_type:complete
VGTYIPQYRTRTHFFEKIDHVPTLFIDVKNEVGGVPAFWFFLFFGLYIFGELAPPTIKL